MWLVVGAGAIIFAILNLTWAFKQKKSKWFGFISLSLTFAWQPKHSSQKEPVSYICGLRTRIECEREGEHSTRK